MVTRTETYGHTGSRKEFTVPDDISSDVTTRAWGAGGLAASASASIDTAAGSGQPGGYAEGDLPVNAGDTLYVYVGGHTWPNGGSGLAVSGGDASADAGDGGGASIVRYLGTSDSDTVTEAGGGAGGSAAAADGTDTSNTAKTGSGGRGAGSSGAGEDGDSVDVAGQTLSGGSGGATASGDGNDSMTATDSDGAAAASGGGGGGRAGGGAGDVYASMSGVDGAGDAGAAGSGAGDGYLDSSLSNTSSTIGGGAAAGNTGQIDLVYETPLRAASNLTITTEAETSLTVEWTVTEDHPDAQQRVEYREDGASTWQTYSTGLSLSTTTETVDGLKHGEAYEISVVTYTDSESVRDTT